AAEPFFRVQQSTRPLAVVLDDSYSMHAGGAQSARALAMDALRKQLDAAPPYSVRFVLAGDKPQVLAEAARTPSEAMGQLEGWRCLSPIARLSPALAVAGEIGGDQALLLVLTDRAPPPGSVGGQGRVQWWAFGKKRGNVAFVGASRTARDGRDRCLLEVANLGDEPATRTLSVLDRQRLELSPGQVRRVVVALPPGTGEVEAKLDADDLPLDDRVILQPVAPRPVGYAFQMADNRLREALKRGLDATGGVRLAAKSPDLLLTDRAGDVKAGDDAWVCQFLAGEGKPAGYTGPFVLDRTHPLADGLSMRGTVWGCGQEEEIDGAPVVMAGNAVLLSDARREASSGAVRHHLRFRYRHALSTLANTPDWPILLANLVSWRAQSLPGPERPNVRVGESVHVGLPGYRDSASLRSPTDSRTLPVKGRVAAWPANQPGTWTLVADKESWKVSANFLDAEESDLRGCEAGRWGDWIDETTLRLEYRGVSWLLLILLLGVACAHLVLMRQAPRLEGTVRR
ncbi:MAG: hypothetical protein K2W96_19965, partial [Gemmataceae bacterium]|nr:hypothetical protein [Gemmataceae bacterium]